MKPKSLLAYVVCFTLFVFGACVKGRAQQNLFNIPSGDITDKNRVFYQHQFNVYQEKVESKGHFVYGLGKGWEVGANLVGKGFYYTPEWRGLYNSDRSRGAVYPVLMGTTQKQFRVADRFAVNVGAQAGFNLSNKLDNKTMAYQVYSVGTWFFGKKNSSRLVGGVYHGNQMFLGTGNTTGVMAGYEIKVAKRWYLMGDWVSGRNDAGVAVIGGMYNAGRRVQLCAGWLLPNPHTPKPMGIVLEVNILGWDLF